VCRTSTHTYLPMKVEQTECSETLAYKIQKTGNYPEESIQQVFVMIPHFGVQVARCIVVEETVLKNEHGLCIMFLVFLQ